MIIRLHEIPKEGKTFHVDRHTGDLDDNLNDLIGKRDYESNFQVLPIGKAFDLSGRIQTSLGTICSFCATEFDLNVNEKFHELIIKDEAKKLTGISDYNPEDNTSVSVASGDLTYDVGQLIHEIIALAEPFQPLCKSDCKGLCSGCGANLNEEECRCAEQKNEVTSPFSVLKKMKLI
jgi:uncharacterized protein